ncbi:hypothetical protein HN51_063498 [Arachis hypogaea]
MHKGQLSKVREVLLEMKGSGVSPNRNPYNILVHGYCKLRRLKEAAEVVDERIIYTLFGIVFSMFLVESSCF